MNRRDEEHVRLLQGGGANSDLLSQLLFRIQTLEQGLAQTQADQSAALQSAVIANLVKNGDFKHSVLSYTGAGSNTNAAFWYRGCDTVNVINGTTAPKWQITEGWLEITTTADADDVSYNFPTRQIDAGQSLYLQFIARLKDASSAQGFALQAGVWDKTAGIDTWLSASLVGAGSTAPTVTKIGPGAAATNYGYKVAAYFDDGSVIVSTEGTVLGAATLNATDKNRIAWTAVQGARNYKVFRTTGPTLGLIGEIASGGTSFDDQGTTIQVGVAVPTSAPPQAKVVVSNFVAQLTSEWQPFRLVIPVPSGYSLANTGADKQWLRLGFKGTGTMPAILLDRVGLSFAPGGFAPNAADLETPGDVVIAPVGNYDAPGYLENPDYSYGDYRFYGL